MHASPLTFAPVFFPRVWGGRKLATRYGKTLPGEQRIGESWEVVDRPEAQSIVQGGKWHGLSLHHLWSNHRDEVFGEVPAAPRFPLLVKLLDCREKLSLQVHPPPELAAQFGGEPKTEGWFIADADAEAEIYLGFAREVDREGFQQCLGNSAAAEFIQRLPVKKGDVFSVPSGRLHAIGAGCLVMEVQQNSDTTYRVFDWNRHDQNGQDRQLHLKQALPCIDFSDVTPQRVATNGNRLLRTEFFEVARFDLRTSTELAPRGKFAIAFCAQGLVQCAGESFTAGCFFLLPAEARDRSVISSSENAELLRITLPN